MKIKSLSIFSSFLFLIFLFAVVSYDVNGNSKRWKAGVAKVVITPEQPMFMAGYSGRDHPAEGKLHDLWAKALVLEDASDERVVLVTTDLIGFNKYMLDRIRDRLKSKFGLTRAQVILSSSHNHSGPILYPKLDIYPWLNIFQPDTSELYKVKKYANKLEDQIVVLVGEALDSMVPVQVFSGKGVARFAVNRRKHRSKTTIDQLTYELEGPVDHSVPVIKVAKTSGELLAVVFGYACHATTISIYQWSGDYPGFAQIALEEAFPETTAMFFQGAGGNQNPLPRGTVGFARQYGKTLAAAVERVLLDEDMCQLSSHLSIAYSEVDLQFANPPPTKDELLQIMEESSGWPDYLKYSAKVLLNKRELCSGFCLVDGKSLMTSYPYPIQIWRIGEQNMVVLGGEVVIDYTIRLKQIFGQDLFMMAYANDVMSYIPTAAIIKEGGYEGTRSPIFTTPWASDIEMVIIKEVIRLAEQTGIIP